MRLWNALLMLLGAATICLVVAASMPTELPYRYSHDPQGCINYSAPWSDT